MQFSTWQDLENFKDSPEGQAQFKREEDRFRDGFFDAVNKICDAVNDGLDLRQLRFYYDTVYEWRYHVPCTEIIYPPDLPEPWRKIRQRILKRDHHICHYCGNKAGTVDHKISVKHGGTDEDINLVACCFQCNRKKHVTSYEDFIK